MNAPCPRCGGKGYMEVGGVLDETLALLLRHPESTAKELSMISGNNYSKTMNRLSMLEKSGLATSRLDGRHRFFKAAEHAACGA